jgi:DNA mismatch repair protein MutS
MIQVDDLKIEREVIPLFDYTLNPYAQNHLKQLILRLPIGLEEISHRQSILKGMLQNQYILKNYSYNKIDFMEVHQFLNGIIGNSATFKKTRTIDIFKFSQNPNHIRLRVGIIQFIQLFSRLQNRYFSHLNLDAFPQLFCNNLQEIETVLSILDLKTYETKIIENNFSIKDCYNVYNQFKNQASTELLASFWNNLFLFEAYLSLSKAIFHNGFCFPEFNDSNKIILKDFYHPLLKSAVRNDLIILEENVLLITGPNMSGKSTLLKSISLCIYLAHAGLAVPATSCNIPYYESISITINHFDDLQSGHSHFMTELLRLKSVVELAASGKKCFAVFDEIFKGTNPEDATIISDKTLNGLLKFKQSTFFISTHLHALKNNVLIENVYHLECSLDKPAPEFSYRLKKGWSNLKIGQLLFNQIGLNDLLS